MRVTEHAAGLSALLTDLYQLTMAYGFWKSGMADRCAVFHLGFRKHPFGGQYAVACGLAQVVEFLRALRFTDGDLKYLASLRGGDSNALFDDEFLRYLGELRFACDMDAVVEGTVVFAHEPLLRIRGPLLQAQIVETALLTLVNFPTLVATKAARIAGVAGGRPVLEFGLRRAQGVDGGVTASRAAYIGGCAATSNVLAGKLYGIPVKGTHGHSWVMAFDSELEAFQRYADAMPANCIFLVDTYGTLDGVRHAIQVGRQLGDKGFRMLGIRLDSGDLVALSQQARRMLNEAGMSEAAIVASGDLDEYEISRLLTAGAEIDVWGVGTRLATAFDEPALAGVYKLAALQAPNGHWTYRLKLSDQQAKTSDPGILQVRRFYQADSIPVADAVYDEATGIEARPSVVSWDGSSPIRLDAPTKSEDLLVPVFRAGRLVYDPPDAATARGRTQSQWAALPEEIRRLENPQPYPVGRESRWDAMRRRLLENVRNR
ncbi:MAG: nicotinate phosphoribosyltransferase [Pirellulaceae bacterium]|nr:nicotinate phosphoribosyltransferase [Pirellulaceae bacterium]